MKVIGNARARRRPEIHSQVEPGRVVNLTQRRQRTFRLVHHLVRDLFRSRVKLARVQVRHDHQMTGNVRVKIQEHETMLRTV